MNTLGLRQEDAVDREGYAPFYIPSSMATVLLLQSA